MCQGLCVDISVYESTNHSLVLRLMFCCLGLKKVDAFFAESKRDFHALFPKDIFALRHNPRAGAGLVQQTVQIVASLRSHDLTLFVRRQLGEHANSN